MRIANCSIHTSEFKIRSEPRILLFGKRFEKSLQCLDLAAGGIDGDGVGMSVHGRRPRKNCRKSQDTFICAGSSLDGYRTVPDMASTQAK